MKALGGTFNQEKSLEGAFSFETDGSLAALPRAQENGEMYFQHLLHNGSVRGRQLGKLRHVHNSFGTINKVTGADVHKCTGIIINVINPSSLVTIVLWWQYRVSQNQLEKLEAAKAT